jgi:hypothetical protein
MTRLGWSNKPRVRTIVSGTHTKTHAKASKYGVRWVWWKAKRWNPKSSLLLRVGKIQKLKCQSDDHYKHGKDVELTHGISGVSATKEWAEKCMKPESKVARCHTNTRRGKALVANEETTRFTRGLSSLFSLLLKSFFLFLYLVALTLLCVFVCMMALAHFCSMVHLHSFCVLAAFSRTMLALARFCYLATRVLLRSLTPHYTHTSQSGPRAMSRNTR